MSECIACSYSSKGECKECETRRIIKTLEAKLKASQAIIKEAHDKLVNVNAVSWEETAYEVKELLKIKEPKQ
jgi:hypothetical protein